MLLTWLRSASLRQEPLPQAPFLADTAETLDPLVPCLPQAPPPENPVTKPSALW